MSLIRWEPFRESDEFFNRLAPLLANRWPRMPGDTAGAKFEWSPAADISETEKEYLVKADLPGVKREDVKITLQDGVITIEGERVQKKEEKSEKTHRVESFYGTFLRSFTVPEDADARNVRAESKDGVLYVHVPKLKVEKPKPVEIKVE
jgi:HSP20 family protein